MRGQGDRTWVTRCSLRPSDTLLVYELKLRTKRELWVYTDNLPAVIMLQ